MLEISIMVKAVIFDLDNTLLDFRNESSSIKAAIQGMIQSVK